MRPAAADKILSFLARRPNVTLAYSLSDLAGVALTGAVVAAWAAVAEGSFSVRALVACEAVFLAFSSLPGDAWRRGPSSICRCAC